MTDMYEAGELLAHIQWIVDKAGDKTIVQTPDGRDPVYWPITIHGHTGMMHIDKTLEDSLPPPNNRHLPATDQPAQTSK